MRFLHALAIFNSSNSCIFDIYVVRLLRWLVLDVFVWNIRLTKVLIVCAGTIDISAPGVGTE